MGSHGIRFSDVPEENEPYDPWSGPISDEDSALATRIEQQLIPGLATFAKRLLDGSATEHDRKQIIRDTINALVA